MMTIPTSLTYSLILREGNILQHLVSNNIIPMTEISRTHQIPSESKMFSYNIFFFWLVQYRKDGFRRVSKAWFWFWVHNDPIEAEGIRAEQEQY